MTTAVPVAKKKEHSRLGASSYDRWGACAAAPRLSDGIPNTSSVYAMEGTLAHKIGEKILKGEPVLESDWVLEDGSLFDGDREELLEAVQVYVDHVNALRARNPSFQAVEQRVDLSEYHPELFGTADFVCYYASTKTLYVVDYKHGKGIPVDAAENKQLMYYALGALHGSKVGADKVVITVVQPRCYHPDGPVRTWETDPMVLLEFAHFLVLDAKKTEDPAAVAVPGEHCRFCPAAGVSCDKVRNQAVEKAQAAFQDETLPAEIVKVTPEKIAQYLTMIPQIEAWCSAVNKYAHQQASLGNPPPGFKLVQKQARGKWDEGMDEDFLWKEFRLDREESCNVKLKTPPQIKKILKEKVPKEKFKDAEFLLDQFVVRESSGTTLVPMDDPRPAAVGQIEKMFGNE